jgi:uncharacterized protein (DUF697 family)
MVFLSQFKHFMPDRNSRLHAIIHGAAIESGGIGLATAQIPGDRLVIGSVQMSMVIQIASEFGEELDKSAATALLQSALATLIGVEVFNGIIKYAPGLGNLANMSTASSVTETIGWSTVKYYKMKENN